MLIVRSVVLAAMLASDAKRWADEYRCTYEKKVECTEGRCVSTVIGSAYLLIPHPDSLVQRSISARLDRTPPPQIRRCDSKGCSAIDVDARINGMFTNVTSTGGGYLLKIVSTPIGDAKKGTFVETATIFLASVNYWGTCALP